jgi:hypothetical protein
MRFCSRCGFSMDSVMHLLAHNGMLPSYLAPAGEKTVSPRRKGVRQGVLLMLLGMLLVPIFAIMSNFAPSRLDNAFVFFAAISAIIFFVGGPLRMLFAAIFEDGAKPQYVPGSSYVPPVLPPQPARVSALPPPAVNTQPWRSRSQTAEIMQPPTSVTDHTTRLLEKSESEKE